MLAFFSENIQKFVALGVSAAAVASGIPQTVLLQRYKDVLHVYKDGQKADLDDHTKVLIDKVLDRYNLTPKLEAAIDFFPVYGFDTIHRGTIQMRTGAIVGIPSYVSYTSESDVETEKILVKNDLVDWQSEAGKSLKESLVLSHNAKLFGIAREICNVSSNSVATQAAGTAVSVFVAYWIGYALNNMYQLKARMKLWGRLGMYTVIGSSVFYIHLLCRDTFSVRKDLKTDFQVSKLGQEYAEGGVEFYEKILQRNVAMRSLMGQDGAKAYTMYGNKITSVRDGAAPYTVRRDRMLEHFKQYTSIEK